MAAEDGDVEFFVGEFCWWWWWWRLLWGVGVVICVIHRVVVGGRYLLRDAHGELCEILIVVLVIKVVCEMMVIIVLVVVVVVCSTASSLARGHREM